MCRFPWLMIAVCVLAWGQGMATRNVKPAARPAASGRPFTTFTDVAAAAGLTAPSVYGGAAKVTYMLETTAGGAAMVDYDNDGWVDLFFTGGARFGESAEGATQRLYRNKRDGTFEDVTARAGLTRGGWAQSVAAADYDGDGDVDLFVTYWGRNALHRNNGDGTFTDVAAAAGVQGDRDRLYSGATFLDYDRDGVLDLFVATYLEFDPAKTPKPGENPNCNFKGVPVACGPRGLRPSRHFLYRGLGGGKFADVSEQTGIARLSGSFAMTAVAADFDEDGWPDIYVACDTTPSFYLRNDKGRFVEEGIERRVALNEDGREQAGMGLGVGDFDLDGRLDIFKTHFADDTNVLYRGLPAGEFEDVTLKSGLGVETRYVTWGAGMVDLDNDGWPDLFAATGNVYPELERELPGYPYRTPPVVFRNLGGGKFEQMFLFETAYPARGAAFGDLDNDGDLDVVLWNRNQAPALLRNDLKPGSRWLQVKTGRVGTRVTVRYGGRAQTQVVMSQTSFYSVNDFRLHFGLGTAETADVTVLWPDGREIRMAGVKAGQVLTPQ
jgi:hypothetical protein